MRQMFQAMLNALQNGEDVVLASVIASSGSVPRGAGAKMAVFADGRSEGTIGGGAVEHESIQVAKRALKEKRSDLRSYTLAPDAVANLGMICGGDVEICLQYMSHKDMDNVKLVSAILKLLAQNVDAWLITKMLEGKVSTGLYDEENGLQFLAGETAEALLPQMRTTSVLQRGESMLFVEPLVQSGRVVIFGGGHVAKALVLVLAPLKFRTVIFEDRPEFVAGGILGDFGDINASVTITDRDYAVIMTRGHQADREVLQQVLRTPAAYVGMIGSRKKLQGTLDSLQEIGFTETDFARLHSPIGLSIGAQTPEEIAISIVAEMIQHRANQRGRADQ
ncbi:XdhC family protein [Eubacteriales bacterium OttesenSCG-928-A19]|nr:XdhC family protein [Eubacteriales bacterium OttesenSCG-928-A19]